MLLFMPRGCEVTEPPTNVTTGRLHTTKFKQLSFAERCCPHQPTWPQPSLKRTQTITDTNGCSQVIIACNSVKNA
eukprot:2765544-Amphidinium_carterae.2